MLNKEKEKDFQSENENEIILYLFRSCSIICRGGVNI